MRERRTWPLVALWFLMLALLYHGAHGQEYPNKKLTPGAILTRDAHSVCKPGYSAGVRNVPESEKAKVYKAYGLQPGKGKCAKGCEVDHLISLELGGSNLPANLWPEPYEPRPGAHEKDKVENWLHKQVCTGNMSLSQAQKLIVEDWYHIYICEMAMPDLTQKAHK